MGEERASPGVGHHSMGEQLQSLWLDISMASSDSPPLAESAYPSSLPISSQSNGPHCPLPLSRTCWGQSIPGAMGLMDSQINSWLYSAFPAFMSWGLNSGSRARWVTCHVMDLHLSFAQFLSKMIHREL